MANKEVTLVIKGLQESPAGLDRSTGLGRLLSDGKPAARNPAGGDDALLFQLFGLDAPPDSDVPVAAVTRLLDLGLVDKSWWMRADPVHLVAGRRGLLMAANRQLEISDDEADALVREISEEVLGEGWVLKAPNPHRWYLKPPEPPAISTTPIDQVLGKDIEHYLPSGDDARTWHTRLNEIQILLHTSEINAEREARDQLAINSVWFWGGGVLPQLHSAPWSTVWSDDIVSQALARLSETESRKLPAGFDDWLRQSAGGKHLLVFNRTEAKNWLPEFEDAWASPLIGALKQQDVDRVTVYPGVDEVVELKPSDVKGKWSWFPFGRR